MLRSWTLCCDIYTDEVIVQKNSTNSAIELMTSLRSAATKYNIKYLLYFCDKMVPIIPHGTWREYSKFIAASIPCTMRDDMLKLVNDDLYTDVEIYVSTDVVKRHSFMLKHRSPYLFALLSRWDEVPTINLEELSDDSFTALMEFVYTGKATVTEANAIELLVASKRLLFEDFEKPLMEYVKNYVTLDNAMEVLDVAHRFALDDLVTSIMYFIAMIIHYRKELLNVDVVRKLRQGFYALDEDLKNRIITYSGTIEKMVIAPNDSKAYDIVLGAFDGTGECVPSKLAFALSGIR
jgi:hypothetical protein